MATYNYDRMATFLNFPSNNHSNHLKLIVTDV